MKEMIEKLKDKSYVRAFGLMSEEEQKVFEQTGRPNCLFYSNDNKWETLNKSYDEFYNEMTYAIRPDYQPAFEDLEIEEDIGIIIGTLCPRMLGCYYPTKTGDLPRETFVKISDLPSLPDFDGFYEEANDLKEGLKMGLDIELVARKHYEGKKVFARFRKQK